MRHVGLLIAAFALGFGAYSAGYHDGRSVGRVAAMARAEDAVDRLGYEVQALRAQVTPEQLAEALRRCAEGTVITAEDLEATAGSLDACAAELGRTSNALFRCRRGLR